MEKCKVFVGGLTYSTDEKTLTKVFEEHINEGEAVIVNLRIVRCHETGESRGFGFVTFYSEEQTKKALELDGLKLDGRLIGVKAAVDKRKLR